MAQLEQFAPTYVCAPPAETASRGFWFHEDPLDYTVPATLAQVILVIVTFRLLYFLLKPLGQTKLTCHLLVLALFHASTIVGYIIFIFQSIYESVIILKQVFLLVLPLIRLALSWGLLW